MILEVSWDALWTLPFGLSQYPGHGSWLMCEVALTSLLTTSKRASAPLKNNIAYQIQAIAATLEDTNPTNKDIYLTYKEFTNAFG